MAQPLFHLAFPVSNLDHDGSCPPVSPAESGGHPLDVAEQHRFDLLWIGEVDTESLLVADGLRRPISDHRPIIPSVCEIMKPCGRRSETRHE